MPDTAPLQRRLRPIWPGVAFTAAALALALTSWRSPVRLAVVCLLGLAWVIARRFVCSRSGRCAMLVALIALVGTAWAAEQGREAVALLQRGTVRTWNLYHYYLGTKYFDELGFSDLYRMTVLADREGGRRIPRVREMRDLDDYRVKPIAALLPKQRSAGFSDARWQSFGADVERLTHRVQTDKWAGMFRDRGYNPTPAYTVMVQQLTRVVELDQWGRVVGLCSIDTVLYAVLLLGLGWGFGWEAALLAMLVLTIVPFNHARLVGNVIQYDWLVALGLATALLRHGRYVAGGMLAGYAAAVRVFPIIFAAAVAVPALAAVVRSRALPRKYLAFGLAFALVGVAALGAGSLTHRGFGAWREFAVKIRQHNQEMTYGDGRVGLKHWFTHDIGSSVFEDVEQRRDTLERQWGLYVGAAITFLLVALALLAVVEDWEALILGSLLFFAWVVPSHYYWSVLAFIPLLSPREDGAPGSAQAAAVFLPIAGWYQYSLLGRTGYANYIRFDLLLSVALFALAVGMAVRRWRVSSGRGVSRCTRAGC